ncbi:MAG: cation diffusion facilitator family transporter [Candidatus Sulfotelmatobacter sp.]
MTARSSQKVVYVAIATNLAVMICKYAAAMVTGSSAMLAEALHSTADAGNEFLLLLGMKRSARPPDALHPFGHGKALYFYSLLVAVYIFGVGGILAVYKGITRLKDPHFSSHVSWNYAVLSLAALFDFYSWRISYRELLTRKDPDESTWEEVVGSKDPTVFTVFLEDSAGLAGTFLAFLGIFLGRMLHNPYLDPIASIAIGLLLAAVAILLGRESGALLLGERTNRARVKRLRQIILAESSVEEAGQLLTMQLGPDQVLLTAGIRFRRGLTVEDLESAIARLETLILEKEPTIKRMFLEPDSLNRADADPPHDKYE